MKGGAVQLDGRIEPGDMILQVNDINFENMTNDEAVKVLREVVQKPGPVKLVVAKCWDPNPKGKNKNLKHEGNFDYLKLYFKDISLFLVLSQYDRLILELGLLIHKL